jgi:hypothetical protein
MALTWKTTMKFFTYGHTKQCNGSNYISQMHIGYLPMGPSSSFTCQNQNHKVLKSEELGLKPKPMEPIKTKFNIKTKTKCCLKKKKEQVNIDMYMNIHAC